jgi:release factor glutamine methyltransferase
MHKTIKDILDYGKKYLKSKFIESYKIDCEILLSFLLKKEKEYLIAHDEEIVEEKNLSFFIELIEKRAKNQPIAQLIGKKEFFGYEFLVNRSTLIPRPESESLIEEIINLFCSREEKLIFADFGSGTGCLGISLLKEYKNTKCFFVEKSYNAMKMIKKNSKNLNVSSRSIFLNQSWSNIKIKQKLDFIISNPPYISPDVDLMIDVGKFEPQGALFAKDNGLKCYHDILKIAPKFLKKNGYLIFEIDINYQFIKIPFNFKLIKIKNDLLGLKRVMILQYFKI